jgi:hypothetical protein
MMQKDHIERARRDKWIAIAADTWIVIAIVGLLVSMILYRMGW